MSMTGLAPRQNLHPGRPAIYTPEVENTPHLFVEFYNGTEEMVAESDKAGRPIFKDVEMVAIRWVGDIKRELHAPANGRSLRHPHTNQWLTYKDRFPRHYEAYKAGQHFVGTGTPISELTFLSEANRANLRALNIYTAEALANLDSGAISVIGPMGRKWKTQAEAYISKAGEGAVMSRVTAENDALRAEMEALRNELRAFLSGKPPPAPAPVEQAAPSAPPQKSEEPDFSAWDARTMKDFIKDRLGKAPNYEDAQLRAVCLDLWKQENGR